MAYERGGGGDDSRTEIEFHPALPSGERMIRVYDGIIRDERLQTANLLKIAFGQSATPDASPKMFQLASKAKSWILFFKEITRVPFVEDIGESVISMNGGIAFRCGII